MKQTLISSFRQIAVCVVALSIVLFGANILLAWTGPSGTAPTGNVAAPINSGDLAQTIGSSLPTIITGGVVSPNKLIVGAVPGSAPNSSICLGGTCISSWTDASVGRNATRQVFAASGTWTNPDAGGVVAVQCWGAGGGGGGGGGAANNGGNGGGGGGGGGYGEVVLSQNCIACGRSCGHGWCLGALARIQTERTGTPGGNTFVWWISHRPRRERGQEQPVKLSQAGRCVMGQGGAGGFGGGDGGGYYRI
jgi:hypothetical protein